MSYFYGNSIVNIAGFKAIIWSFLWKNAFDCYIAIEMHEVIMLMSLQHVFMHNGVIMSSSKVNQFCTQKS